MNRCGNDLTCYSASNTAVAPGDVPGPNSNGNTPQAKTEASATALEGEPLVAMAPGPAAGSPAAADPATTVNATVRIRGEAGSATRLYPMNATQHVDHIWLTDGTGNLLGNHSFVAPRAEDGGDAAAAAAADVETFRDPNLKPTATFAVPADVAELQAHSYSAKHGLQSGPVIDAQMTMAVAAIEQQARHPNGTSIDPEGPHSFRVTDGLNDATATGMDEYDPYTIFDPDTATGTVTVLGLDGAVPALPDDDAAGHGISALWATDQHDTVVAMQEYDPADAHRPVLELDLAGQVPPATEIRPFAFSPTRGLVKGSDVFSDMAAVPDVFEPPVVHPPDDSGTGDSTSGAADNGDDGGLGGGAIAGIAAGALLLAGAVGVAVTGAGGSGGAGTPPLGTGGPAATSNPAPAGGVDGFGFAAAGAGAGAPAMASDDGYLEVEVPAGGP